MNTTYQWLVRRGRLGLYLDGDYAELEVDPQGHDSCELTARDASEIAGILTQFGHAIWNTSPKGGDYQQSVTMQPDNIYAWDTDAGSLRVSLTNCQDGIQMSLNETVAKCRLGVGPIVEVVQVLDHLVSLFKPTKKWWQFWK